MNEAFSSERRSGNMDMSLENTYRDFAAVDCTSANRKLLLLQRRIIDVMSLVAVIIGVPLLFELYLRDSKFGLPFNFIISCLTYCGFVLTLLFRRKLSMELRAATILLLLLISAFVGLFHFGLLGSGILTIQSALLLGGMFLGYRKALWLLPVVILMMSVMAGRFISGQTTYSFSVEAYTVSWTSWLGWISLFTVYSLGILICFRLIQKNLQTTIMELSLKTEELEKAKIRLENASNTKDRFLEMMSHELRTPINPIVGLADVMTEQYSHDSEATENLTIIRSSAEHLLRLIDQILDATTIERGDVICSPYWSNLSSIFEELEVLYRRQANEKNLEYSLNTELAKDAEYYVDTKKLEQILKELTDNAIRFTEKGSVKVSVFERMDVASNDMTLNFEVEDEGIGMSTENTEHLQSLFTQFDSSRTRKYQGLGIGLAIASKLTKLLGGELSFESEIGLGSKISFSIPCKKRVKASLRTETDRIPRAEEPAIPSILIAEDDFLNRKIAFNLFSRLGLKVTLVEDGIRAVEACRQGTFSAVFMDVSMPRMDGIQATRELRKLDHCKDIPIIALTAHNSKTTEMLCRKAGMTDFLTKPATKEKIKGALERMGSASELCVR